VSVQQTDKTVIGIEEWFNFPTLQIPLIKARIDTGAKTSSLHAFDIVSVRRQGKHYVRFCAHPLQRNKKITVACEAEVYDERIVKSSSGHKEQRYVIQVPIKAGQRDWLVEVNLTDRDSMGYRLLIGREALAGRFFIDPARSFCLGETERESIKQVYAALRRV
jgi:ribosomal protein S6--L-glutamate ligase